MLQKAAITSQAVESKHADRSALPHALRNTPPHTCLIRQLPCLAQVPNVFSLEAVADAYPTKYEESMNTVLQQVILMGSGCKYSVSCSGPGVIRR